MRGKDFRRNLHNFAYLERAKIMQHFFKTGEGEYGEGDIFLGVTVPDSRKVAKKFAHLPIDEMKVLLDSRVHEERLVALLILVHKYSTASRIEKEEIAKFYLGNIKQVNSWDLVDLSAPSILGDYLMNRDKSLLFRLAKSCNLWKRRVAIVATLYFIRKNEFRETLKIAEMFLADKHDLIHKAAGWMLREVGKRNLIAEEAFLNKHYTVMPRTMLRYAIERFPEKKKRHYMKISR